jgi:ATP synthase in type III secretion protein N
MTARSTTGGGGGAAAEPLPTPELEDLGEALARLDATNPLRVAGRVTEVTGLVVRAAVPGIHLGEVIRIDAGGSRVDAEVVGFRGDEVVLMPLGELRGIGPDALVSPTGGPLALRVGYGLLGRVLGGLGQPMDEAGPIGGETVMWPVDRPAPDPLRRLRIDRPLASGVRAIDAFATMGEGQRVGVFAGPGVGKSVLLGQIARSTDADVNVICLVGERGREVADFLESALGQRGLARSVIVCATSDAPAMVRIKAGFVATAIAEWFRDQGERVMFMMDSVTRLARAQREVGLAAGEPPARQGYPPSVFALLPRLLERTGNNDRGTITALYTVLVTGGDMDEPIADEVRGILDGHIVLSRDLAVRNHWPAIDVLASLSRSMTAVSDADHQRVAGELRGVLAIYERQRDLIGLGAYRRGSDPRTDDAIARIDGIEAFLRQRTDEAAPMAETVQRLKHLQRT